MSRIPLPGNGAEAFQRGIEHGTGMFSQLLGQGVQRAQHQQQAEYQQQRLMQELMRHQENMAMKQQQLALSQANQPLETEAIKAKIDAMRALAEQRRSGGSGNPIRDARTEQLVNSHKWSSMTPSSKENIVAMGNSLGIRPDILVEGMTQGKSFEDIAQEHGYNKEQISKAIPKYLATTSNVKLENERQKKVAELNVLEDRVTDAMAPYIQTFYGKSPQFIADALRGKSVDEQAKYLAARALQPEMGALRINVMGGNVGHGAIEELIQAALGKSDIPQSLITPEVYKKMSHYTKKWLNEASQAATESIYGRSQASSQYGTARKPVDNMTLEEIEAELSGGGH